MAASEPEGRPGGAVTLLLPAAGRGLRLGGTRKQFRILGGKPLLLQTLNVFDRHPGVDHIVVAAPEEHLEALTHGFARDLEKLRAVVPGGATRQASVRAALDAAPADTGIVLVHDAVRPFVQPEGVAAVIEAARAHGAAALAVPLTDTLRRGVDGRFGETVPREGLYRMQTPQGFRVERFRAAHEAAEAAGYTATDDVDLVQRLGEAVHIVEGGPLNLKITTPADWELAQRLWTWRKD